MLRAFGPETDGFTDFLLPRVPGDTTDLATHDVTAALRACARALWRRDDADTTDTLNAAVGFDETAATAPYDAR